MNNQIILQEKYSLIIQTLSNKTNITNIINVHESQLQQQKDHTHFFQTMYKVLNHKIVKLQEQHLPKICMFNKVVEKTIHKKVSGKNIEQ